MATLYSGGTKGVDQVFAEYASKVKHYTLHIKPNNLPYDLSYLTYRLEEINKKYLGGGRVLTKPSVIRL